MQECLLSLNEINDFFFIILQKKKIFGTWKFGKIDVLINFNFFPQFSQFFLWEVNLRGLRAFILQTVQGSVVETEKKVLLHITQLGKEETLIILLSAWDRSRDSTQKRNLSKHMWRTTMPRFLLTHLKLSEFFCITDFLTKITPSWPIISKINHWVHANPSFCWSREDMKWKLLLRFTHL